MTDDKILEAMVDAFDFTILGTRGNRQDALNAMQAALTAYRAVSDDAKDGGGCFWWEDGEMWESSCGAVYQFTDGGPMDNDHKYCHLCGRHIELQRETGYSLEHLGPIVRALEQTPEMKALREPNVDALHAKCLELLKALGHEEGCGIYVCSSNASYKNKCQQCGANEDAFRHDKFTAGGHSFVASPCNCAHSKLAALLGRTAG